MRCLVATFCSGVSGVMAVIFCSCWGLRRGLSGALGFA